MITLPHIRYFTTHKNFPIFQIVQIKYYQKCIDQTFKNSMTSNTTWVAIEVKLLQIHLAEV
jgi:hypothetical protein